MGLEYGNVAPISRIDTDRDPTEQACPSVQVFAHQKRHITLTLEFATMVPEQRPERMPANLLNYCARSLLRIACPRKAPTGPTRRSSARSSTSTVWKRCSR